MRVIIYDRIAPLVSDELDAPVGQARALDAGIVEELHVNPRANHRECWIRDPDGYVVVVVGDVGNAGGRESAR